MTRRWVHLAVAGATLSVLFWRPGAGPFLDGLRSLALLILFQTPPGRWFERNLLSVTFAVPSVILAQFTVAAAFAVRTMRVTFDQINPRQEQVAL